MHRPVQGVAVLRPLLILAFALAVSPGKPSSDGAVSMDVRNAAFQRGNEAYLRGNLNEALSLWRYANSPPGSGLSFHGPALANIAFLQFTVWGKHSEGLKTYYQAVHFEPKNLDIRINLSGVLAQLGNFSEALKVTLGSPTPICHVGTMEHARASAAQLSICVQLYTNIASALKQEPALQRIVIDAPDTSLLQPATGTRSAPSLYGHAHYLDLAMDFVGMAVSREPAVRFHRKCTVKIVRLGDDVADFNSWSGLVQLVAIQGHQPGRRYGQQVPYDTITASASGLLARSNRLLYLSASAEPQHQTSQYWERRVLLANFSRVVISSPVVKDGEPLIIDPSRCTIYSRYDDQLPSSWWKAVHREWLRDTVVAPFNGVGSSAVQKHQNCDSYIERAATPTQRWTGNYFHFIAECCSRLVGLLESEALKGDRLMPLLLPAFSDASPPFIGQAFELLLGLSRESSKGISHTADGRPILYHPSNGGFRLCFKTLLTLDWQPSEGDVRPGYDPNPPRSLLRETRRRLLAAVLNKTNPPVLSRRVVYVSRAGASSRRIANEKALVRALNQTLTSSLPAASELVVFGSDYDLRQTIELFSTTTVIVGVHGAGLTNMLFMPHQSAVLELALPEPCFRDYLHLSAAMDHVYAAMVLPPRGYNSEIIVDVDEASAHFAALLSAPPPPLPFYDYKSANAG